MCIPYFYKSISELKGDLLLKGNSLSELKKRTEILIIDDEPFSFYETLRKHEYNLTQKKDLTDLKDAEAYKIILCDIRGVGNFLGSEFGGAYLIKQLKEKYPEKTIIAYTANDYNAKFQKYLEYADEMISKGGFALEDWTALLDSLIKESSDPVKIWEKTKSNLIVAGVPTVSIAKFESEYVKAIKKGNFESFQKLYEKDSRPGSDIMFALFKALPDIISIIKG